MKRLLPALLLIGALPAHALVNCSVGVSGAGLSFGVYNPLDTGPRLTSGTLTVTCSLLSGGPINVPLRIELGTGSSGNFGLRQMQSAPYAMNYNLFRDAAFLQVWGDGTGGSLVSTGSVRLTPGQSTRSLAATIYGQIPALQDPGPGNYADTILVTVIY